MKTMTNNTTYETTEPVSVRVYSWDQAWRLIGWAQVIPAGTRFTVLHNCWMPPGSDCVPEVRIKVDLPTNRGRRNEMERVHAVGRAVLDLGKVRELHTAGQQ